MATQPEIIRQSEMLNQLVLQRNTMEELGRIEVMWAYLPSHRVLGFVCKSGFMGVNKAAFKLSQIVAFGENGILTHSQPEETTAEKVNKLESIINCEVWSDTGNKIGKVVDFLFNVRSGEITEYLFVSNGWSGITGEVYLLPPKYILNPGNKRLLVSESAIQSFKLHREGIKQKLFKVREVVREDYTQATQELRSFTQQAQSATQKATGRFRNLAEQARERAQNLSQQARETVQNLGEQLKEEAQTIAEQAKERSQTLAEQLKERSQTLSRQVEDGIETLTVQAEEVLDHRNEFDRPTSHKTQTGDRTAATDDDLSWVDDIFGTEEPAASSASTQSTDHPQPPSVSFNDDDTWLTDDLPASTSSTPSDQTVEPPTPPSTHDEDDVWFSDDLTASSSSTSKDQTIELPANSHPTSPPTDDDDAWLTDDWADTTTLSSTPPSTHQPASTPTTDDDDDEPWV